MLDRVLFGIVNTHDDNLMEVVHIDVALGVTSVFVFAEFQSEFDNLGNQRHLFHDIFGHSLNIRLLPVNVNAKHFRSHCDKWDLVQIQLGKSGRDSLVVGPIHMLLLKAWCGNKHNWGGMHIIPADNLFHRLQPLLEKQYQCRLYVRGMEPSPRIV